MENSKKEKKADTNKNTQPMQIPLADPALKRLEKLVGIKLNAIKNDWDARWFYLTIAGYYEFLQG